MFGMYRGDNKILSVDTEYLDGLCFINFHEIYYYMKERHDVPVSIFRCMINARIDLSVIPAPPVTVAHKHHKTDASFGSSNVSLWR